MLPNVNMLSVKCIIIENVKSQKVVNNKVSKVLKSFLFSYFEQRQPVDVWRDMINFQNSRKFVRKLKFKKFRSK